MDKKKFILWLEIYRGFYSNNVYSKEDFSKNIATLAIMYRSSLKRKSLTKRFNDETK